MMVILDTHAKKTRNTVAGLCFCLTLTVVGIALQAVVGPVNWANLAFPVNIYLLTAFVALLVALHLLRKRLRFARWASGYGAAVPALAFVVPVTLLMGLTRQVSSEAAASHSFGLDRMLSFWPFVLTYVWMTAILGLVTLRHISNPRRQDIPFICNHLGLFIVLVCATLGSADMQRLKMYVRVGHAESRAIDNNGDVHRLPLSIELKSFDIDEYPPKLMLIDNANGNTPDYLPLDNDTSHGTLDGWNIRIIDKIEQAAPILDSDTIHYKEWHNPGAIYAAYIEAVSTDGRSVETGWVSNGNYRFPYNPLQLDDKCCIVMTDREPMRFVSVVEIITQKNGHMQTDIEVNKPARIDGWKIYQTEYDETKGKWSEYCVFELVRDPWLPAVYTGIVLMALGAMTLFWKPKKNGKEADNGLE